jgi:hypothetical protein
MVGPNNRGGSWNDYRSMRNALNAIAAAGVGIGGYGAMRARNLFTPNELRAGRAGLRSANRGLINYRGKKRNRVANKTRVKVDGSTSKTVTMKRKKRRSRKKKFSAKREIAIIKRRMPKWSKKTFRDFKTIVLPSNSPNLHKIYSIKCFDKVILEDYVKNLTKVDAATVADYSTENSSVKMSNFYKLMLKNNMTSNCNLHYAFFVCKDDDNESPTDSIREELVDRGYTGLPGVTALTVATATTSEIPEQLSLGATSPFHVPVFGNKALLRNWAIQGKVQGAVLGPGDSTSLIWSRKSYTYEQEYKDQENAFEHIKGMSVFLVIAVYGDLAHDQTNFQVVGRGQVQLDCEEHRQTTVRYYNPKGLDEVAYTDTLTNTNFGTPVHADNFASAMEIDDR